MRLRVWLDDGRSVSVEQLGPDHENAGQWWIVEADADDNVVMEAAAPAESAGMFTMMSSMFAQAFPKRA